MVISRIEIKTNILKILNQKVDSLVQNILTIAEINRNNDFVRNMSEIQQIINDVESMKIDGEVNLLKETVAVYENAIKAIDEQLKSEEMERYADYSKNALEAAKKIFEDQTKEGRVGTILSIWEELSKDERSGKIEQRYNDEKIKEKDYSLKSKEKEEEKKVEPFYMILSKTEDSREALKKISRTSKELDDLITERNKYIEKSKANNISDNDKANINKSIAEIEEKFKEKALELKTSENEEEYNINNNEKIEEYIDRVKENVKVKKINAEKALRGVLNEIANNNEFKVELHVGKETDVKDYLKQFVDENNGAQLYTLESKINTDKNILRREIERSEDHKSLENLKKEIESYEKRNAKLQQTTSESQDYESQVEMVVYKKFDWRHPFRSLKQRWNTRKNNSKKEEKTSVDKVDQTILKEIEESINNNFKDNFKHKYSVQDKDKISAHVETRLNTIRASYEEKDDESR